MKIILYVILLLMPCSIKAQVLLSEFIFEHAPFISCHASTIVNLPGDELLAAWFGGTREGDPDVAIWSAKKSRGTWSQPILLSKENNTPCWNPVLFYTQDHTLWFYYKYGTHPSIWSAARNYSKDDGETWSSVEYLPAGLYGPIRAKPLVMNNGIVIAGTSVESYRNWSVWIERSTDQGKTFKKIGPISIPQSKPRTPAMELDNGANDWEHTHGIIQPSVIALGKKHLRLYARATLDIGKIVAADSYDSGLSWTPGYVLEVKNPNSGIDAIRLHDGRIALIFNDTREGRSPLNVAVSSDGIKFNNVYTLENTPGGEFSYPNIIQTPDDLLHITYTWKREKIKHVVLKL